MKAAQRVQGMDMLRFNHAGAMVLKNGRTENYGVIRVTDKELVYYTGKGLREMWKPNASMEEKRKAQELKQIAEEANGEQKLIQSSHIAVIPLDDIERIIF